MAPEPKDRQSQRAEEWLKHVQKASESAGRGRLKVFLGMCAGVGKTFAMLKAAQAERSQGRDVVIGIIETHGRSDTATEAKEIEALPRKSIQYQGTSLEEFDLDAALRRKPQLILVDELAHSNAPGSRHQKRYQDVLELLRAGIDVFTTLNVQHLESRSDSVAGITGIPIRETVPDGVVDQAAEIQLIDLSPEKLLERLSEGKVYLGDRKQAALQNFFKKEHLTALRELALRVTAERVDQDLLTLKRDSGTDRPWQTSDRLLVAIGPNPQGEHLIRAARRMAQRLGSPWIVVYVNDGAKLSVEEERFLERNVSLGRELGAEVVVRDDPDKVEGLIRTARERNATQILLGKPEGTFAFTLRSRWLARLFERAAGLELVFVPTQSTRKRAILASDRPWWMGRRRHFFYALGILALTLGMGRIFYPLVGYYGVGLLSLGAVLTCGFFLSPGAVFALSLGQALAWNFFFVEPRFTFAIDKAEDIGLFAVFILAGVVIGGATARLRLREQRYRSGELEALALADLLALVRDSDHEAKLLRETTVLLERYFGVGSTFLFREMDGKVARYTAIDTVFQPESRELAVASWAIANGREAGRWTDTLREAEAWCCPLTAGGKVLGVWIVQATGATLGNSEREVIRALASSLALGIERIRLAETDQTARVAQESARLQGTLLSSVSHEIRTPLTSVVGFLELWSERTKDGYAQIPAKDILENLLNARDVDRILEDLVSLNRIESGVKAIKLDWIDLEELVSDEAKRVRARYPRHEITGDLGAGDYVLIQGDARLLRIVVHNLLENACKHTPPHSKVRTHWRKNRSVGELWIEDSGHGVPPELRSRIFDRFFRGETNPGVRGLGLGLSIARGFVELLGGEIRYEGSELGGAAFVLSFPSDRVREGKHESEPA